MTTRSMSTWATPDSCAYFLACLTISLSALSASAHADDKIIMRSHVGGRLLQIPADWTAFVSGTPIALWDETQKSNQMWWLRFQKNLGGHRVYTLENVGSAQCLTAMDAMGDQAAPVEQWDCKSTREPRDEQLWMIEPRDDTDKNQWQDVRIQNVRSNLCLTGVCCDNGKAVQQQPCSRLDAQSWAVQPSNTQLIEDCGKKADQCKMQLVEEPRKYWGPPQIISADSMGYVNCTQNLEEVEVTRTKSYMRSYNFEVTPGAASSFATVWNATVGLLFGLTWSWTDSEAFRQKILLEPGEMGQLEYTPQILHTKSRITLDYKQPFYGQYEWEVCDITTDLPLPGTGAIVGRTMPADPPCDLMPKATPGIDDADAVLFND